MARPALVFALALTTVFVAAADGNPGFGWRPRRAAASDTVDTRPPRENRNNCTSRALWQRILFECRPDDNPLVNRLDAIPGCSVFPPKAADGLEQLRPYAYLPPHPFPGERSRAWASMYDAYEWWLYDGGAKDVGDDVREEILFADGATAGKSVLWLGHFITAWAVSKGEMLNEKWTRRKFDAWRW